MDKIAKAEIEYTRACRATDLALVKGDGEGLAHARAVEDEAHARLLQLVQQEKESRR